MINYEFRKTNSQNFGRYLAKKWSKKAKILRGVINKLRQISTNSRAIIAEQSNKFGKSSDDI